jgi:hypothetical protein
MKKLTFLLSLLIVSLSVTSQVIPGVVASSYRVPSGETLHYGPAYTDNFNTYSVASLNGQGNWDVLLNSITVYDGGNGARLVQSYTSTSVTVAQYDATFGTNQYAQITISNVGDVSDAMGVGVRLSGTGATTCGYGYYVMNGTQRLFRIDNGVKTNLGSAGTASISAGATVRLEINGTTITAYLNGSVDTGVGTSGSATVTEYTSGKAGITGYNNGVTLGDLFEAGDIYTDEYYAVYNAMTNKPSVAVGSNQNTLVKTLKACGAWTTFDIFYVFATHSNSGSEALINWKNPGTYNSIIHNTPVFTAYEGFKGTATEGGDDTSNGYLEAGGMYLSNLTKYTLNNASYGLYVRVGYTATEGKWMFGCTNDGNAYNQFSSSFGSYGVIYCLNSTGGEDYANEWSGESRGYWTVDKPNSSDLVLYRNGTLLETASYTSTAVNSYAKPYILCINAPTGPVPKRFCDAQISVVHLGGSLAGLVDDVNAAIETYMDSNSKGIE